MTYYVCLLNMLFDHSSGATDEEISVMFVLESCFHEDCDARNDLICENISVNVNVLEMRLS